MLYKSFGVAIVLALISGAAFSHESEPQLDPEPALAAMRYCQMVGVRAAWGAQARFLGAPAQFKYIAHVPLKKMFMGEVADIPTDGIYVFEEMDLEERQRYEEVAFHGWKQADKWMQQGRERPEYEVLTAVFYDSCKQDLTTRPQVQSSADTDSSGN